ncbi:MAG TPA: gliding motility-associated C-terminal domain-containing protein [Chitinophaga sp.]|uniref:T9SS type B sorting domain-containing protein n=1 Tax=Chitinophaga sp. TaxID=1869181 RepID=UPI002C0DFB0A|nr:gliding motility-associated C-terminal domain-containing protein [Chitinophaga sp.]HVI48428.1 gliding motility-associated C-terminal domain-containing protein [Chitinophaga sp.]
MMISWNAAVNAQDIPLKNPSLEGVPGQNKVPSSWIVGSKTPDTQPGIFEVTLPASDGSTYIGLHSGPDWLEAIAQEVFMKGGRSYALSFDLAFTPEYAYKACYGNMAIYGGDLPGDTAELLWVSGRYEHTSWRRYNAVIRPKKDYRYISFWADYSLTCTKSAHGSVVLIDNISSSLRQYPQLETASTTTCAGINTGTASVKVLSGSGPYTYLWLPGGQTTDHISRVAAGDYKVSVTAFSGLVTTMQVTVKETDLKSEVKVVPSRCNGDNQNQIVLQTTGGLPPYRYYFNGNGHPSYEGVFKELHPGAYAVLIKDEQECADSKPRIKVEEPAPLQIAAVNKKDLSCSDTRDGKILLTVNGGITPYQYTLEPGSWQSDAAWQKLDAGRYYFRVKDNNNCETSGNAEILRNERACAVYVPTAFSPNGDGLNDIFRAKVNDDVSDYRMVVYSRWGQLVFQTSDPASGWDGSQLPVDNYVWVLTYTDSKQQARKQTGTLMLLR